MKTDSCQENLKSYTNARDRRGCGYERVVDQMSQWKRNTTEREGRRRLAGLGKAHAAKIKVEDD